MSRRRALRSSAGQASLEYAAVLGVVLVVLSAGGLRWAPGIVNSVVHGLRRAICEVTGGPCPADERRACTVRSASGEGRIGAKVAIVSLGAGVSLVRATHSDGSVEVTLVRTGDVAVTTSVGASGEVRVGRRHVGISVEAEAELAAMLGRGESWHAADGREADRLQRAILEHVAGTAASSVPVLGGVLRRVQGALRVGEGRALRPPDTRSGSAGGRVTATADSLLGEAGGHGALERTWSEERSTGRRTYGVRLDGALGLQLAGEALGVDGGRAVAASVTVARDGTPLLFTVAKTGDGAGATRFAGAGRIGRGGGAPPDRVHGEARLDLTVPANLAAVRRLLGAVRAADPAAALAAAGEVAARLAEGGRLDVAAYATESTGYGGGGDLGLGARAGVNAEVTRSESRLLDAWSRPAGGVWERRLDCLSGV